MPGGQGIHHVVEVADAAVGWRPAGHIGAGAHQRGVAQVDDRELLGNPRLVGRAEEDRPEHVPTCAIRAPADLLNTVPAKTACDVSQWIAARIDAVNAVAVSLLVACKTLPAN